MRFRARLSEAEQQQRDAFQAKHGATITPPTAEVDGPGFRVVVYLVVEQALRRLVLHISKAGTVDADSEVLETGLPLVVGT